MDARLGLVPALALASCTATTSLDGLSGGYRGCPQPLPPAWLFCDDFETDGVETRYAEYDRFGSPVGGNMKVDSLFRQMDDSHAASGRHAMQVFWHGSQLSAGRLVAAFGKNPRFSTRITPTVDHQEIFWRVRVLHEGDWAGFRHQLGSAMVLANAGGGQAANALIIAPQDPARPNEALQVLGLQPQTCVTTGIVACAMYNDRPKIVDLSRSYGMRKILEPGESSRWHCIEGRMKLNPVGTNDGAVELWVDDVADTKQTNIDLRGRYDAFGINAVIVETGWWQGTNGANHRRWIDDLVISTERIGCE